MLALGAAKIKATENRVPRVFDKVCSREPHVEIQRPSLSGLHAALTLGGTYTSSLCPSIYIFHRQGDGSSGLLL